MFKHAFGKLAIAGLLLLTVVGGTVATASARGTHPGTNAARAAAPLGGKAGPAVQAELALMAKTIGISEADLKTALKGGQTVAQVAQTHNVTAQAVIDAVVKDITAKEQARPAWAKLTTAQQTARATKTTQRVTNFVNNGVKTGTKAGAGARHPLARAAKAEYGVAAKTIGITAADLRTAVKGGQTVAQVAQAHNVTAQAVIDAVVKDITAKAQARPAWAKLTAARQTAFTTKTTERVTNWVNGTAKTK